MSKHTPGPWVVIDSMDNSHNPRLCIGWAADKNPSEGWLERCVCWIMSSFGDMEESKVNARLIAAAPELLEALKDVLPL